MHYWAGQVGHFLVVFSFIASLFGLLGFYLGEKEQDISWKRVGNWLLGLQSVSVVGLFAMLLWMFAHRYYEYQYVWSHASNELQAQYLVSCIWEGQEGSFLLWLLWTAMIQLFIIGFKPGYSRVVLMTLASISAILSSMLLGIDIGPVHLGSSPFILAREAMANLPVFAINPDYIPSNGQGLNPLLQNYWMVIHPPTLFLGFALTSVPFAVAVAGLSDASFRHLWLKEAKWWTLITILILGIGIMMGAYWAYETLNFGGYWNWDPVENAVYVPWLFLVGSLHAMIVVRKESQIRVYTMLAASFLLILYSTFLTRSGILGDSSVHSFTDLGLSGQLLFFMGVYVVLAFWIGLKGKKALALPEAKGANSQSTIEMLLQLGITILVLAAFQVILTTSIPVYNAIVGAFGVASKAAPPSNVIAHYSKWQMGFACATVLTAVLGQFFFKLKKDKILNVLFYAGIAALLGTVYYIFWGPLATWYYIGFFLIAAFGIAANVYLLYRAAAKSTTGLGGTLAHLGLYSMFIGILFSAGYDKVISLNNSGLVYRKDFSTEMNRDNVLLWRKKPMQMGKYLVTYQGPKTETYAGTLVHSDSIFKIEEQKNRAIYLGSNAPAKGLKKGDSLWVRAENTYYEVSYLDTASKELFTLFPRAQINPNMGLLASPDVLVGLAKDLYTHVSSIPPRDQPKEWSKPEEVEVAIGGRFFINDFAAELIELKPITKIDFLEDLKFDAAVEAQVKIYTEMGEVIAKPIFVIQGNQVGRIPTTIEDLGVRLALEHINHKEGKLTFSVSTTQRDWIIMKAVEKPIVSTVWGGFLLMCGGIVVAMVRKKR